MTDNDFERTEAELLASIVMRTGSTRYMGAAVQRSHRFPYHLFTQIEKMAEVAGVPVSIIINQLIECGLEAVKKQLADDIVKKLTHVSKDQSQRSLKSIKIDSKRKDSSSRNKPKG